LRNGIGWPIAQTLAVPLKVAKKPAIRRRFTWRETFSRVSLLLPLRVFGQFQKAGKARKRRQATSKIAAALTETLIRKIVNVQQPP